MKVSYKCIRIKNFGSTVIDHYYDLTLDDLYDDEEIREMEERCVYNALVQPSCEEDFLP